MIHEKSEKSAELLRVKQRMQQLEAEKRDLTARAKEQARALETLSKETRASQSGRKNQDATIENLVSEYVWTRVAHVVLAVGARRKFSQRHCQRNARPVFAAHSPTNQPSPPRYHHHHQIRRALKVVGCQGKGEGRGAAP